MSHVLMLKTDQVGTPVSRPISAKGFVGSIQPARYLTITGVVCLAAFLLALGMFAVAGHSTGATMLPERMGMKQSADPAIVAEPFNLRYWAALKLARIAHEQPEIVSIGSSRGMEVRAELFKPYRFYNASLSSWTVGQEIQIVERVLQVAKPRIIIIGLDYIMFTDHYADEMAATRTMLFDNGWTYRYESSLNLFREFFNVPSVFWMAWDAWRAGNVPYQVGPYKLLGIDAMRGVTGFRLDGSMLMPAATYEQARGKIERNEGLIDAAPGAPRMAERQLADLNRLADLARKKGVKLVAIQYPILKKTVDFLDHDANYQYYAGLWRDFESASMANRLSDLGIDFFDLSRDPMGGTDQYFMDAAHTTEFGMSVAVSRLLENARFKALFPAIDAKRIEAERNDAIERGSLYEIYDKRQ